MKFKNRIYIEIMKQFGILVRWKDNRKNPIDHISCIEITFLFVTVTVWL